MNVFGELFGGVLKNIDAEEVFKNIATRATANVAKGPLSKLFQKMKAASRAALAEKLEKLAGHLRKGECDAAAEMAADIIDDVKL